MSYLAAFLIRIISKSFEQAEFISLYNNFASTGQFKAAEIQ